MSKATTASQPPRFPTDGGYLFAVDPELSAPTANPTWTPKADPWTLILQAPPSWIATAPAGDRGTSGSLLGATYQRITVGGEIVQACLLGEDLGASEPAALVLLDDATPDRLEALARYWRGLHTPPAPPDPRVTPMRRQRLRQMLRAVDARLEHETYRAIASMLFPKHRTEAASWAGDAVRETTIRLARDGMKLVHGGYRDLLKRPRKP